MTELADTVYFCFGAAIDAAIAQLLTHLFCAINIFENFLLQIQDYTSSTITSSTIIKIST